MNSRKRKRNEGDVYKCKTVNTDTNNNEATTERGEKMGSNGDYTKINGTAINYNRQEEMEDEIDAEVRQMEEEGNFEGMQEMENKIVLRTDMVVADELIGGKDGEKGKAREKGTKEKGKAGIKIKRKEEGTKEEFHGKGEREMHEEREGSIKEGRQEMDDEINTEECVNLHIQEVRMTTEENIMNNLDIQLQITQSEVANLGVGTLNINGATIALLPILSWLMKRCKLDILMIQDARISERELPHWARQWQQLMGTTAKIRVSRGTVSNYVGGCGYLIGAKMGASLISVWQDASNLGIIMDSVFRIGSHQKLRVVNVYWPSRAYGGEHQLSTKLTDYLKHQRDELAMDEYIIEQIQSRVRKPAKLLILGGDFNQSNLELQPWLQILNLTRTHEGHYPTRYSGTKPGRQIDHIFSNTQTCGNGISLDPLFSHISDHRPLWGYWSVNSPDLVHYIPAKPRKRAIKMSNPAELQAYQQQMEKYVDTHSVMENKEGEWLHDISCYMVNKFTRPINGTKHFWSPYMAGCLLMQKQIGKLRNIATLGQIRQTLEIAKGKICNIGKHGNQVWEQISEHIAQIKHGPNFKAQARNCMLKLFHAKRRKKQMENIYKAIEKRDMIPSQIFKSLKAESSQVPTDKLVQDGTTILDPMTIHNHATSFYQEYFMDQGNHDHHIHMYEEALGRLVNTSESGWLTALTQKKEIANKINEHLQSLEEGPTLEEFLHAIKYSKKKSAPGPTGATYEMYRALPRTIQIHLYDCLKVIWKQGHLPQWMTTKLLRMIPKEDRTTLDMSAVRPLMLLEALRKIWFNIIATKIKNTWEENSILEGTQYAYRKGRRCSNGIIQLINAIENAQDTGSELYISSWDIRRAFDSVSRPMILLSLQRLGVPRSVAERISYADKDDKVTVITPASMTSINAPSFRTEIGIGQGDVISPVIWIAFMDILLTMLNKPTNALEVIDADGNLGQVKECAYADDLLTFSGSVEHLKATAGIVQEFAHRAGIRLADHKFRSFVINGQESVHTLTHESAPNLQLQIKKHGLLKYLGSRKALLEPHHGELASLQEWLQATANEVKGKMIKPETQRRYVSAVMESKAIYQTQHTAGSINRLQTMDTLLGKMYKQSCHLPPHCPSRMPYSLETKRKED